MLEVLYHHAKFGGDRISPAAGVEKKVEFFLFVHHACSVRHAYDVTLVTSRFWMSELWSDFTMKTLEYRNDFDAVG